MIAPMSERWNHNLHYHPLVLDAVPAGAQTALDVGCGEGTLARRLSDRVPRVVGIDLDPLSVELARQEGGEGIEYVLGDVLTESLGQFDVVTSVATLHHMDARVGLRRFAELVRPGGRLVVVGLARSGTLDVPRDFAAAVADRANAIVNRRRVTWEHPSPNVWPPPETFTAMRGIVKEVLPGARYRRHLYLRWSLVWDRPAA